MEQSSPFLSLQKGISVLLNVFHRADVNGDGVLSKDEFLDFFSDGILTESELEDFFTKFDLHNTGSVDAAELCSFFWRHIGHFPAVVSSLEELDSAINRATGACDKDYANYSAEEQFVTRFMIKESQHQLLGFIQLLENARKKVDDNAIPVIDRQSPPRAGIPKAEEFCKVIRAPPVKVKRQMLTQTSLQLEDTSEDLKAQVRKLERLIQQLENQPTFSNLRNASVDIKEEQMLHLVQHSLLPDEGMEDQLETSLKSYAEQTKTVGGSIYTCLCKKPENPSYFVYELWEHAIAWRRHIRSEVSKAFQHQNVDCLKTTETVIVLEIPSSWWQLSL